MNDRTEISALDRVLPNLKEMGLKVVVPVHARRATNVATPARVRIGRGKETTEYVVEMQPTIGPSTLGATVARLRDRSDAVGIPSLLVANHVTPPVADALRRHRQQFVDEAGNAYLEGPALFVYVTGRKPSAIHRRATTPKTFTVNALKVMFALLHDPALAAAPSRTIAASAGVALGSVPATLSGLRATGHLLVAATNRRLDATKRLLDEWSLAYARVLRPKTLAATYASPNVRKWRGWSLDPAQALWGGEPAAHLLVGHLEPGVLTLYAERIPSDLSIRQRITRDAPSNPARQIELRTPFWGETLRTEASNRTVSPVLVYADLLATGDGRCIETAQMIYDGCLARRLPAR